MPDLIDSAFDLDELSFASIFDFPFDSYFISEQVIDRPFTQVPSEWIRGTAWPKITGSRVGLIVRGSRWGVIK